MRTKRTLFLAFGFYSLFLGGAFPQTPTPGPVVLKTYTLQKGDAFSDVVGAYLKNSALGQELLKFNSLKDPGQVYAGFVLFIPAEEVLEKLKGKSDGEAEALRQNMLIEATLVALEPARTASKAAATPAPLRTPTLKISGSKTINISYSQSMGSGMTGISNFGYGRHESLRLNAEGQLNDQVKIIGHYSQSDLALEDEYDLTLTAGRWEAFFGNFGIAIPGSQYLSSGMSSTGIRLKGTYDTWDVTALYGTPRGRIVYDKFYGNNTQGPYNLSTKPITPGTETVMINKDRLARGTDYQIDDTLGQITFRNRVVFPADLVEVQYQSRSTLFNTDAYGYHVNALLAGSKEGKGAKWNVGQGYLRQAEQPDPGITAATARAAADTHMIALDSTLDLGPAFKLNGETAYSFYISSDTALTPSHHGGAYRVQADSFQGPFHVAGKYSKTEPSFSAIGNPVMSNDYQEWALSGDFKPSDRFYARFARSFQRTSAVGANDETTTDHGEAKARPAGFPSAQYAYYNSSEVRTDPANPVQQQSLRHSGDLGFSLPGKLSFKTGAEYQEQNGNNTGTIRSRGGNAVLSSEGWKGFNFSVSGAWKLNDILQAGSNTMVAQTPPGSDIFSQTYTLAMEGKPVENFSLTAKGAYSSDPPGPPRSNLAASCQTNPFKWLSSNANYTLEFNQRPALGGTASGQVHSISGSADLSLIPWWKLSAQPSFRFEVLPDYDQKTSESLHQGYRSSLNPSFINCNADYSHDRFRNWDVSTPGFPLQFEQTTEAWGVTGQKGIFPNLSLSGGYKRSDQNQVNYAAATVVSQNRTTHQNENDALSWNASKVLTLTFSHAYNQLDQSSPGQGIAPNPLLPYGPDTFSTSFSTNSLNIATRAHTFTFRATEQLAQNLSVYEEGGYTATQDALQGGFTQTYSPGAGFTWKPAAFLNWSGSYQYNGSSGQVSTQIQKAQTALSANLNEQTSMALNWSWSQASNPDLVNQQGNMSFTMGF